MRIVLHLPEVKRENEERPTRCPYCKGEMFQRWGFVRRQIKDTKVRRVKIPRYKCTSCKSTFRFYPEGVSSSQQSKRLEKLCVIMWSLGLSHRSVVLILSAFGIGLSHMSAWRDLQQAGKAIRRKLKWKPVRVAGIDGAWGNGKGIMVAVDMGNGELLELVEIDEKEKEKVAAWLSILKQKHEIGAIVTDDLVTYKEISDEFGLAHQVCQFHVRRWVGKALKKLEEQVPEEWLYAIPIIRELIDDLPKDGGKLLYKLWKEMPGRTTTPEEKRTSLEKLRDLVLRLSRDWERYIEFYSDPGIPWTNNRTEQTIGRLKSRAKRVRGYKTSQGMEMGSLVAAQFWT